MERLTRFMSSLRPSGPVDQPVTKVDPDVLRILDIPLMQRLGNNFPDDLPFLNHDQVLKELRSAENDPNYTNPENSPLDYKMIARLGKKFPPDMEFPNHDAILACMSGFNQEQE